MEFSMLVTVCPADKSQEIVDSAKGVGATGATVLSARGTGVKEAKTFFGLSLDQPQETIYMLVKKEHVQKIMSAIYDAGDMKKPGNGICYAVPVEAVVGLESQLSLMKE